MAMCDVAHYDAFDMAIRSNLWRMEMNKIFITIFAALGFMVVLALFMLAVGQCYGF